MSQHSDEYFRLKAERIGAYQEMLTGVGPVDPVNRPAHYLQGKIEVLDFILDQKFDFLDGQVIKYVARARHKGAELQDLQKAQFYLNRKVAQLTQDIGVPNESDPVAAASPEGPLRLPEEIELAVTALVKATYADADAAAEVQHQTEFFLDVARDDLLFAIRDALTASHAREAAAREEARREAILECVEIADVPNYSSVVTDMLDLLSDPTPTGQTTKGAPEGER